MKRRGLTLIRLMVPLAMLAAIAVAGLLGVVINQFKRRESDRRVEEHREKIVLESNERLEKQDKCPHPDPYFTGVYIADPGSNDFKGLTFDTPYIERPWFLMKRCRTCDKILRVKLDENKKTAMQCLEHFFNE